jgi:magnesium chelatase family protein
VAEVRVRQAARAREAARPELRCDPVEEDARELLRAAAEHGLLSGRGAERVARVARTIADLDASDRVRIGDVEAALALRTEAALGRRTAAAADPDLSALKQGSPPADDDRDGVARRST